MVLSAFNGIGYDKTSFTESLSSVILSDFSLLSKYNFNFWSINKLLLVSAVLIFHLIIPISSSCLLISLIVAFEGIGYVRKSRTQLSNHPKATMS